MVDVQRHRSLAGVVVPEEEAALRVGQVIDEGPIERLGLPEGGST
jgi:hypothetical protein